MRGFVRRTSTRAATMRGFWASGWKSAETPSDLRRARCVFEDLTDRVDRLVLRLVIRPRHQFRQQPQREHLYGDEDEQDAEQEQRPAGDRLLPRQSHVR